MGEKLTKISISATGILNCNDNWRCHFRETISEERVNSVFMLFKNNYLLSPWRVTDNNNYSSSILFSFFLSNGLSANQLVQVFLRALIIRFLPSYSLSSYRKRGNCLLKYQREYCLIIEACSWVMFEIRGGAERMKWTRARFILQHLCIVISLSSFFSLVAL